MLRTFSRLVSILVPPHLLRVGSSSPTRPLQTRAPLPQPLAIDLMADNTRSDRKPSLLGGDDRPADTGDEALLLDLEVPNETDLSWVERGLYSALGVPLEATPPTDPAGGELAVGLTGDLYYIPSGTPQKLDDSLGDQLWSRMGWDDQNSVINLEKEQDSDE